MSLYSDALKEKAMEILDEHPGGISWKELNLAIGYPPDASTPFRIIRELEQAGKVERVRAMQPDKLKKHEDRRHTPRMLIRRKA